MPENPKGDLVTWLLRRFGPSAKSPEYASLQDPATLQFQSTVTMSIVGEDSSVTGDPMPTKKAAEQSAAKKALEELPRLHLSGEEGHRGGAGLQGVRAGDPGVPLSVWTRFPSSRLVEVPAKP